MYRFLTAASLAALFAYSQTASAAPPHPGRLLASNCFQCHGTNGSGGFDRLNGESADSLYNELREFALKEGSDADNIMSVHAKGYTDAQMRAIAVYLANIR